MLRSSSPLALLAACASTPTPPPQTGPRGLHASEHLSAASDYEQRARERPRWPDEGASPTSIGTPWMRRWDASGQDEQIAAIHRSRAAELVAEYQRACGDRPLSEVSVSPIQRHATAAWPTATGVIIYLDPSAGSPDKLLADIECHRAWMMLAPSGMDDCPLDLPGIELDARGDHDSITLSIVVRDPAYVDELHRRAAHDVESSSQLHHTTR